MTADEDRFPHSDRGRREWLFVRTRLLGRAGVAGLAIGVLGTLVSTRILGDGRFAIAQVFSIGALVLGVAVLGWSGSVAAGRSIEAMQTYLETGTDWTESDSRRAMARVGGFGAGVMVGASIATLVL